MGAGQPCGHRIQQHRLSEYPREDSLARGQEHGRGACLCMTYRPTEAIRS